MYVPVAEKIVRSLQVSQQSVEVINIYEKQVNVCVSCQVLAHIHLKARTRDMYQRGGLSHISLSDLELSFALHQVTLFGGQTALFTCPAHLNKDLIYFSEGCIPRCSLCFLYHQL